jgi:hypothetical protein
MKKITSFFVFMAMVMALFVSSVSADVFRDLDDINYVFGTSTSYQGDFNIVTGDGDTWDSWGFNPLTDVIEYAYIMFTFSYTGTFGMSMPVELFWTGGFENFSVISNEVSIFSADITEADYPLSWEALSTTGILDYTVGQLDCWGLLLPLSQRNPKTARQKAP